MINKYTLFNLLKKKVPFIYRIGDTLYYLGCAACRECTADEQKLFEEYQKEYERLCTEIVEHPKCLNADSGVCIADILQRILTLPDSDYCADRERKSNQELIALLNSLDDLTLSDLEKQIRDFVVALDFKDGRFYHYIDQEETL